MRLSTLSQITRPVWFWNPPKMFCVQKAKSALLLDNLNSSSEIISWESNALLWKLMRWPILWQTKVKFWALSSGTAVVISQLCVSVCSDFALENETTLYALVVGRRKRGDGKCMRLLEMLLLGACEVDKVSLYYVLYRQHIRWV